jgi:hypothetical protein
LAYSAERLLIATRHPQKDGDSGCHRNHRPQ